MSYKRQRLTSVNPYSSPHSSHDSLSSLSPTNSRNSDEDDDEPISTKKTPQKTRPGVIAGKGPRKVPPPVPVPIAPPMEISLSTVPPAPFIPLPEPEKSHPTISSKILPPAGQPIPVAVLPNDSSTSSDGAKIRITGMVSGKGKKGEEALEKGVAAREEVERRRVEYRGNATAATASGQNGNPTTGSSSTGLSIRLKVVEKEKVKIEAEQPVVAAPEAVDFVKKERPAISEERENIIRFITVTNDGSPSSLIILTGLKNIFQKQLPKMPKEYIARLVYDRNHYSMAIVKRGLEVVGGITYRPFESRKFAEIVFCAITGTEQVKGYGSHLMNHLKDHVKKSTQCNHFLTYADNYAIGYFKKQGFSKEVGIARDVWAGYIKDYEGGTIMHCKMLDRIDYLDVSNILTKQKDIILGEIRLSSQSHVVHPGLACFLPENDKSAGKLIISGGVASQRKIDPSQVPGLRESGWTPEMDELTRRPSRHPQFSIMQRLLTVMGDHPSAWAFDHPVNRAEVTDYYDVITEPMDLATMSRKLEANTYRDLDDFLRDARLIFSNCRAYNDVGSNYVKFANKLEQFMNDQLKVYTS